MQEWSNRGTKTYVQMRPSLKEHSTGLCGPYNQHFPSINTIRCAILSPEHHPFARSITRKPHAHSYTHAHTSVRSVAIHGFVPGFCYTRSCPNGWMQFQVVFQSLPIMGWTITGFTWIDGPLLCRITVDFHSMKNLQPSLTDLDDSWVLQRRKRCFAMETLISTLAEWWVKISYYGYRSTALSDSKEKTDVMNLKCALIVDLERSSSFGDEKEVF